MEYIDNDYFLKLRPDSLKFIRKKNGYNDKSVKDAVEVLDEWVKKQRHFVKKNFSKHYLETAIMTSKGSIEQAKKQIDRICTFRTALPRHFGDFNIRKDFEDLFSVGLFTFLPRMDDNHCRVLLCKATNNNFTPDIVVHISRLVIMLLEYCRQYDYNDGFVIVMDLLDVDVGRLIENINIFDFREAVKIALEGYNVRVKGVYFISQSRWIEAFVKIVKMVSSEKVKNRIYAFKDIESVHDYVPQEIFSKDYGGKELPLEDLCENQKKILSTEEYRALLRESLCARTDESLRPVDKFNENYLGLSGTFRSLNVD